jgi:microcystin-dependent protein
MSVNLPNTIVNLTPADGQKVMQNFNELADYINTQVVTRDGLVALVQPLLLSGAPTQDDHAATKAYVDSILPPGMIAPYGGDVAPLGWAMCDGGLSSKTAFPKTYEAIGDRYGTGDSGNFRRPNLRGRYPIGLSATATMSALGQTGGSRDAVVVNHTHPSPTLPAHTHGNNHGHTVASGGGSHTHGSVANTTWLRRLTFYATGSTRRKVVTKETGYANNEEAMQTEFLNSINSDNSSHSHTINNYTGNTTGIAGTAPTIPISSPSNGVSGTGANMPPFLVVHYIIRMA